VEAGADLREALMRPVIARPELIQRGLSADNEGVPNGPRVTRLALVVLSFLALGLGACGTQEIDPKKVEQLIQGGLDRQGASQGVKSVKCPSGQPSKTGETFECTLTGTDGATAPVPVRVTDGEKGVVAVGQRATAGSQAGSADGRRAAREFDAAYTQLANAHSRYSSRVTKDAEAGNIAAIDADMSKLRDDYYRFDGEIRKIKMPSAVRTEYYRVLENDRAVIADLDAYAAATSKAEKLRMIRRVSEDIDPKPNQRLEAALERVK
jgi:Domain of unknown function (DUF4333)